MKRVFPGKSISFYSKFINSQAYLLTLQKFVSTVSGLFYGAMNAARYPDYARDVRGNLIEDVAMLTLFGRVMYPAVAFTAAMATYTIVEGNVESVRQKKDPWNAAFGGGAAGLLIGVLTKRMDKVIPSILGCSIAMATADAFGLGMTFVQRYGDDYVGRSNTDTVEENDPARQRESEELTTLKEKYPKFKDL